MRPLTSPSVAVALLGMTAALTACGGGGGSGSSAGFSVAGSTSSVATAGSSSSTTPGTTTTTPAGSPLPVGTWEVQGTDARGAYSGFAVVSSAAPVYTVERIVTYATKLPDGRALVHAWNGTATLDAAGLHVQTSLRRADFLKRLGSFQRTAADAQPLALTLNLADAKGAAPATFAVGTKIDGANETWTLSNAAAPLMPHASVTTHPIHSLDSKIRKAFFLLYSTYHLLPRVAPYVNRPEFQDAIHYVRVDRTAKDFYRQLGGATAVVILDKVVDEISIAEETQRANAFSRRLYEKAKLFDSDLKNKHVDATNFVAWVDPRTGARRTSGDGALFQGVWVASQSYRYQVTKDPEALANVETGLKGLLTLVDICTNKTEFARAIQDAASAPPTWIRGTGAYANLAYLPGGNNDMMHGIDYGFIAAESVLPAGHPLRAEMAKQAKSLLANVSLAQKGSHEILLRYVAWKTTGDPALQKEYENSLGTKNLKDQLWLALGDGMIQEQAITDWSGHHLAQCDLLALQLLGGSSPSFAENLWRQAAISGAKAAFRNVGSCRLGLLSVIAGAAKAPGASDVGKEILDEIPYPKPQGDAEMDLRITSEFCLSPYPRLPWKGDWMKDEGRMQGIEARPYFQQGCPDNYWNPLMLGFRAGWRLELGPGQDFVHAYWYARLTGQISASD